tara:strand:- start:5624 stop:6463 length:840 start_codon:yes stop_codon:yes gene_type:complete
MAGNFFLTTKHVSVANAQEFVYIKGDANTNGSIRFKPEEFDGINAQLELRTDGVWNDTGLQLSPGTLNLGRGLGVKAAGEYLNAKSNITGEDSMLPHIIFDEAGTKKFAHVPILSNPVIRFVAQPSEPDDIVFTTWQQVTAAPTRSATSVLYVKTGSTPATEDVLITWRENGFDGIVTALKRFPASTFTANTEVAIDFGELLTSVVGTLVYFTMESDAPMSMKGNLLFPSLWFAIDAYDFSEEDLMTSTTGMNRMLITNAGDTISDNEGNLILDQEPPA